MTLLYLHLRNMALVAVVLLCCFHGLDGFELTDDDIKAGMEFAIGAEKERLDIENELLGTEPEPDSPNDRIQNLAGTSPQIQEDDKNAEFVIEFMRGVCERKRCTKQDISEFSKMSIPEGLNGRCAKPVTCTEEAMKIRTIDGTCNNLRRPREGSSNTAQGRLIEPVYEDGFNAAREMSVTGVPLSSPRLISEYVLVDKKFLRRSKTSLLTFFGQTVSHDYSITPMIRASGKEFLCCEEALMGKRVHPGCLVIPISKKDRFFSRFEETCMEFIRSTAALNNECTFGWREQDNAITTHMDASFVYGSNDELASKIRVHSDGLLKTSHGDLMPQKIGEKNCTVRQKNCEFLAGDKRSNENVGLTTVHTIFMREHNRVAKYMKRIRPNWGDEKLYQESRKIVIAFMQNMVMKEYLPAIMSPEMLKEHGLEFPEKLDPSIYDPDIKVEVSNAFSTAAFRFAHTMINDKITYAYKDRHQVDRPLFKKLFSPKDIYFPWRFTGIANGMLIQHPRMCSVHMAASMSKRLFSKDDNKHGMDLGSLNIQRGRDHGLPAYNEFRKYCKLEPFKNIADMPITTAQKKSLRQVYKHVDDIDLFVGGLLEPIPEGSEVGATFGCIIGEQYRVLVKGDRFYYANGQKSPADPAFVGHSYTESQFEEFKKASLARIICDNTNIDTIQPEAMKADGHRNEMRSCKKIKRPSLRKIIKDL